MSKQDKNIPQKILRISGRPGNQEKSAKEQRISGLRRLIAIGAIALSGLGIAYDVKSDAEAYKNSPSVDYVVKDGDTLYDIAARFTDGDPRKLSDQLTADYGTKILPGQSITFHIGTNPSEYAEQVANDQEHQRQLAQNEAGQG